jgi:hypothetical protein
MQGVAISRSTCSPTPPAKWWSRPRPRPRPCGRAAGTALQPLAKLTAGPMALKSSRSAAPILPHSISSKMQRSAEGQRRQPALAAPLEIGPCRRGWRRPRAASRFCQADPPPRSSQPTRTNYSRDWIMMKLEFFLAFGTDLQKVKKPSKEGRRRAPPRAAQAGKTPGRAARGADRKRRCARRFLRSRPAAPINLQGNPSTSQANRQTR